LTFQARLLSELPSLPELAGENVRLAAAQLAAFVPCSILEAQGSRGFPDAPATPGEGHNGNGNGNGNGGSDAEFVAIDSPVGDGSVASMEALPAGARPA
jgi:hypothetical protein